MLNGDNGGATVGLLGFGGVVPGTFGTSRQYGPV
jgi:hypothetical protein